MKVPFLLCATFFVVFAQLSLAVTNKNLSHTGVSLHADPAGSDPLPSVTDDSLTDDEIQVYPVGDPKKAEISKEGYLQLGIKFLDYTNIHPDIPMFSGDRQIEHHMSLSPDSPELDRNVAKELGIEDDGVLFRRNFENPDNKDIPTTFSFYFRLSGLNLYYTESKGDISVLGAISVKNIIDPEGNISERCFSIQESEEDLWVMCADDDKSKKEWLCAINKVLGRGCDDPELPTVKEEIIKQPLMMVPLPSPFCNEVWNYATHGSKWNCKCAEGRAQSPIDLPNRRKAEPINNEIVMEYHAMDIPKDQDTLDLVLEDKNIMKIKGNWGKMYHSVLDWSSGSLKTHAVTYQSSEIQIHTPSEHTIEGKQYAMEMQFHHIGVSKGDIIKKAVISVLFDMNPRVSNLFFDQVDLIGLPSMDHPTQHLYDVKMDFWNALNIDTSAEAAYPFSYYKYTGSLTAPPCDEHTLWIVKSEPVDMSNTTLQMLMDVLKPLDKSIAPDGTCGAKGKTIVDMGQYPNSKGNNRATQPLNERLVQHYTGNCKPETTSRPTGHYEKVESTMTKDLFVDSPEPSGIPGAMVVPQDEAEGAPQTFLRQVDD